MVSLRVVVVGTGYVGLVSGVCFAEIGHRVTCVDSDQDKIKCLKNNEIPIYEPGLKELVLSNVKKNTINFTTNLNESLTECDVIIIAVGTPSGEDGSTNLNYVFDAVKQIHGIRSDVVVVVKSTVPPGTCDKIAEMLRNQLGRDVEVASNPEFLREGNAIEDFMRPDRVVLGCESGHALQVMESLYSYHIKNGVKIVSSNRITSELIKYSSNTFLALKVAFINEMSSICEKVNANVYDVKVGLGSDSRIGPKFLQPGPGFGGSCFPKDISSLIYLSNQISSNNVLVKSVLESNQKRILEVAKYAKDIAKSGKIITVLGLTYKANTDDVRTSPAIDIVKHLLKDYKINVYDPMGMESARKILKESVHYFDNPYEAAQDSSLVVIATEWDDFKSIDSNKMKNKMKTANIYDLRGIVDVVSFRNSGFKVKVVGISDGGV